MKKKIAIQFFGHLRTFDKTYKSFFKNVISPNMKDGYEIDIFIHTWSEREHSSVTFRNQGGEIMNNNILTEEIKKLAEYIYAPKKISIEEQIKIEEKIFYEKLYKSKKSLTALINMTYSINRSTEIRNEYEKSANIKYDWILVTRPDIEFFTPLRLNDFLSDYNRSDLDIPSNAIFYSEKKFARAKVDDTKFIGGSDLVYFGTPENINNATNLYNTWYKINKCLEVIEQENFYSFESWYMDYWKREKLNPIAIDYEVIRDFYPLFNKTKLSLSNIKYKTKKNVEYIMKYILPYNFIMWLKSKK